jgi:hypothetical protein
MLLLLLLLLLPLHTERRIGQHVVKGEVDVTIEDNGPSVFDF